MKPTALVLNILVASITSFRFVRADLVNWRLLLPFAVSAVPLAFLGGMAQLPGQYYRPLVGGILLISAIRLAMSSSLSLDVAISRPPVWLSLIAGAVIGLVSGLTGTGGGIFLSPLLVFMGWASFRTASGVAAVFILANSVAGLAGNFAALVSLPNETVYYAMSVAAGALFGSWAGANRMTLPALGRLLALVLLIAGLKLLLT